MKSILNTLLGQETCSIVSTMVNMEYFCFATYSGPLLLKGKTPLPLPTEAPTDGSEIQFVSLADLLEDEMHQLPVDTELSKLLRSFRSYLDAVADAEAVVAAIAAAAAQEASEEAAKLAAASVSKGK